MATDDQVFRLTWVFDGKTFTADISQAAANAISQMGAVENADVRLTNVHVQNTKKRTDASKQEIDSTKQVAQAQVAAASSMASTFAPATERIITSIARQDQTMNRLRATYDLLGSQITKTQRDIDTFSDIINRNGASSEKGAEAAGLLVVALQKLQSLQAAKAITSAPGLGGMDVVTQQINDAIDASKRYAQVGLDPIIAKHEQASTSARNMASELAAVDAAYRINVIDEEKAVELNNKIIETYNLAA